ncbi:MAG: ABC transporter ATP-binding protein [Gammaproteobacteria bacterium]
MTSPLIVVNRLSKHFGAAAAVDDVSLQVYDGEFLALLGPSGCGKTTLLRMLGGFEQPGEGEISIDGIDMRGLPPNKRPVNMVFQSYAIFPHLSARDNIAYGLRVVGTPKAETARRVDEALALVRMESFADKRPDNLSGGQRQRIALARALVKKPKVLLLDEPLSALDAKLRDLMRAELVNLQKTVGITFIIVTHDQDEALSVAGRIAVMKDGGIIQTAAPRTLYESPANKFVADFIGRMNIIPARQQQPATGQTPPMYDIEGVGIFPIGGNAAKNATVAAIRPEKLTLHPANANAADANDANANDNAGGEDNTGDKNNAGGECQVKATVGAISYRGGETLITLQTKQGATLTASSTNKTRTQTPPEAGQPLLIRWSPNDMIALAD